MAHGFRIICEKCGSENCRIETLVSQECAEAFIICDDCGQEE
jgi:transcription elongation factor Elf1